MCRMTNFWTPQIVAFAQTVAIFTDDEHALWNLIKKGLNNKEIARELGVSESTVSRRLRDLREKYDYIASKYPELPRRTKEK